MGYYLLVFYTKSYILSPDKNAAYDQSQSAAHGVAHPDAAYPGAHPAHDLESYPVPDLAAQYISHPTYDLESYEESHA